MPERITAVRLTAEEKQTLTDAVRAQHADAVAREVKASLKASSDAVSATAKAADLDVNSLRTARENLGARQRVLESLPQGEAQQEALAANAAALRIAEEAISMLGG